MNKKISLSLAVSIAALTAAVTFILTLSFTRKAFNDKITEVDRLSDKYEKLEELDTKVREEYYTEIPEQGVMDGILEGYVAGLGDPYSVYRAENDFEAYEDSNEGVYTGIGVTVQRGDDDSANIVDVSEGGSADKAGIEPGDSIVEVEGLPVAQDYEGAINKIPGEAGTSVSLRVKKGDSGEVVDITVERVRIDEETVRAQMLEHDIGYIQITKFRLVSADQFLDAFDDLRGQGAKGFIFDVRDNGGGVLSALETMVDPILPEGDLAFSFDKDQNATPILTSDAESAQMPYVVLVNGNTASASELFACLLRDYMGAKLVGEKTYGKGVMQTTFPLSGGGLTLTTATYATAKTPCYQGVGLEPDVPCVQDEDSEEDTQLQAARDTIAQMLP